MISIYPKLRPRVALRREQLPPRNKAVTIGIGFSCKDGIVICSDRQMTAQGSHKFQKNKIFYMQEAVTSTTLLFSYAGNEAPAMAFYQYFKAELLKELRLPSDPLVSPYDRRRIFFEKVYKDRRAKMIWTLVALRSPVFGLCLFRSDGQFVREGYSEYIGLGDSSILRYATDLLVQPLDSVWEAQVIGSYVVRLANRYVDGCSGGPDISILHADGAVNQGTGGCFPDEAARFAYCEKEVGKVMRDLLLSGGTKEAFTRSASQTSEDQR